MKNNSKKKTSVKKKALSKRRPTKASHSPQAKLRKVGIITSYAIQRAIKKGYSNAQIKRLFPNVNDRNIVNARVKLSGAQKKPKKEEQLKKGLVKLDDKSIIQNLTKAGVLRGISKTGVIVPSKEAISLLETRLNKINKKIDSLTRTIVDEKVGSGEKYFAREERGGLVDERIIIVNALSARLEKKDLVRFYTLMKELS